MAKKIWHWRVAAVKLDSKILVIYPHLRIKWSRQFLKQHPNLATVVSQQLDLGQGIDLLQDILANWLAVFQKAVATIDPQNIYNIDETGYGIGTDEWSRVIID